MDSSQYRIRGTRKMRKMSGTEVAKRLGISPQYYYDLEKGKKTLSTEYALQLAEIFDVSLEFLLGLPPAENPPFLDKSKSEWDAHDMNLTEVEAPPHWASAKDIRDFKKMLEEDAPVMFDGVPIEGEARQRVMDILTGLFWEAKELNKQTYGKKRTKDNDDSSNDMQK